MAAQTSEWRSKGEFEIQIENSWGGLVSGLTHSTDNQTVVVVGKKNFTDGFVCLVNLETGVVLVHVEFEHVAATCVTRLALVEGICFFVVGFGDGSLRSFRQDETGNNLVKCEEIVHEHASNVNIVAMNSTGRVLASVSWDHKVRMWDVDLTGAITSSTLGGGGTLQEHPWMIRGMAWSPTNEHLLATACEDGHVRLFDVGVGAAAKVTMGKVGDRFNPPNCLAFDPGDDATIAVGYSSGQVARWDIRASNVGVREIIVAHHVAVTCIQYSPCGGVLATGGVDNVVKLWNTTEVKLVAMADEPELIAHTETKLMWIGTTCLEFNPSDPSLLLSCSSGGVVRRWDVPECAFRLPLEGPSPPDSPPSAAGGGGSARATTPPLPDDDGSSDGGGGKRPRNKENATLRFGDLVRLTSSLSLTVHRDPKTQKLIGFTAPRSQVMITPKDASQVIHDMVVAKHGSAKACSLFQ